MARDRTYYLLLAATILCALAAAVTLIPDGAADEDCFFGYRAHCSFAPISTALCIVAAWVLCAVRARRKRRG
jgi:hypothetical protein